MKTYKETIQKVAIAQAFDAFRASDRVIAIIADIFDMEYDVVDSDVADLKADWVVAHDDWEAEQAAGLAKMGG